MDCEDFTRIPSAALGLERLAHPLLGGYLHHQEGDHSHDVSMMEVELRPEWSTVQARPREGRPALISKANEALFGNFLHRRIQPVEYGFQNQEVFFRVPLAAARSLRMPPVPRLD